MLDAETIFPILGTIFSFFLSFSPTVPFIQVFQRKEKIEILPEGMLLCQLLNRLLWGSVWVLTKRLIPFINTAIGILITTVFLTLYIYLFFHRMFLKTFSKFLILVCLESVIFFGAIIYGNVSVVSITAMIFNVAMYIAPGQKILRVIKEKNYILIPIRSTIVSILCSGSWLLYGIVIKLIPQIVPNALGLFFSILNTLAWIYFYNNRSVEKNKEEETFEVINTSSFNYN
jgi:solute carrier family 50 protein (sugar transporter)